MLFWHVFKWSAHFCYTIPSVLLDGLNLCPSLSTRFKRFTVKLKDPRIQGLYQQNTSVQLSTSICLPSDLSQKTYGHPRREARSANVDGCSNSTRTSLKCSERRYTSQRWGTDQSPALPLQILVPSVVNGSTFREISISLRIHICNSATTPLWSREGTDLVF